MTRTIVLRGGPLDGHMREVEDGTRTGYFPYTTATADELARLGLQPGATGVILVLVYKESAPGLPVWKYVGANHAPPPKAD